MAEYSVWRKWRMSGPVIRFLRWICLPQQQYLALMWKKRMNEELKVRLFQNNRPQARPSGSENTDGFTDVHVGAPGRIHNARVLATSPLYKMAEEQDGYLFPREDALTVNGVEIPVHLIGNAAYPLKKWLMKCFTDECTLTPDQRHFNSQLSSACMVLDNAFGRLKGRWMCLLKRTDVDVTFMPDIVTACCILHNVCELNKEDFLPEWTADSEVLQQPNMDLYRDTVMDGAQAIRDTMVTIV